LPSKQYHSFLNWTTFSLVCYTANDEENGPRATHASEPCQGGSSSSKEPSESAAFRPSLSQTSSFFFKFPYLEWCNSRSVRFFDVFYYLSSRVNECKHKQSRTKVP
jgi:hypothetical protein